MRHPPKAPRSRPAWLFTGQVLGSTAEINRSFTLNHQPVLAPGLDDVRGFNQTVSIREVIS